MWWIGSIGEPCLFAKMGECFGCRSACCCSRMVFVVQEAGRSLHFTDASRNCRHCNGFLVPSLNDAATSPSLLRRAGLMDSTCSRSCRPDQVATTTTTTMAFTRGVFGDVDMICPLLLHIFQRCTIWYRYQDDIHIPNSG